LIGHLVNLLSIFERKKLSRREDWSKLSQMTFEGMLFSSKWLTKWHVHKMAKHTKLVSNLSSSYSIFLFQIFDNCLSHDCPCIPKNLFENGAWVFSHPLTEGLFHLTKMVPGQTFYSACFAFITLHPCSIKKKNGLTK